METEKQYAPTVLVWSPAGIAITIMPTTAQRMNVTHNQRLDAAKFDAVLEASSMDCIAYCQEKIRQAAADTAPDPQ